MKTDDISKAQGHWILAKMGKKVLRPGGKELTIKLISALGITPADDIAEFAPGIGFTAALALKCNPMSYVGIDADEEAVNKLKEKIQGSNVRFITGSAACTSLDDHSKDKVFGEAMLTMQADHRKSEIIREAHRILKPGGLYAIHELGLTGVDEKLKGEIQKDLATVIKVNARPLTETEWKSLLQREGFAVRNVFTNDMHLLKPQRIISDEGFFRALRIGFNILTTPAARKRIVAMRRVFHKYHRHLNAIVIISEKNSNHKIERS